jgi:uncharacterized RDD family membrane protein YckC
MIVCGYYTLFFVGSYRETIGEMLFGLRVLSANVVKMHYIKVFVRNRNFALNNLVIVSVQPYRELYKGRGPTPKSYGHLNGMVIT